VDTRHIPAERNLFRYDLANNPVVTVRCRDGNAQDCHPSIGDQMSLVLEPSLVWTRNIEGFKAARMQVVGLDRIVSIEFSRGATQETRWVRDPNGFWLRLTDQGQ